MGFMRPGNDAIAPDSLMELSRFDHWIPDGLLSPARLFPSGPMNQSAQVVAPNVQSIHPGNA